MSSNEQLNADWHKPSNKDIDEIMNNMRESKEPLDNSQYCTTKEFVTQYSKALEDYINETAGKGESHILDFAAHTASFGTAFFHTINNFS